ncbi:hypothetical protein CGRA01v4_13361 [Colletotrichum graminicola]|uniref:Uncharacterized protein n=1 Tax=Colletotrichum graminicola (strain M1.001 / M2 / FGSC 10212) TaxID=645133 RepID=E3QWV5_COLGM|nr:uncharacterized protein GLRG_10487 [Colletotrichum graminicola M1.001]EFQ35343.1 hypothetical protein GLRG_10487 [Colletotrichum graminicola M1.001]WDK22071.1 hypothetical protein CGRA01v4_13361 [Colletotrichum graminicola]
MGSSHSVTSKPDGYYGLQAISAHAVRLCGPSYYPEDVLDLAQGQQDRFHGIFDEEDEARYAIERGWEMEKYKATQTLTGRELRHSLRDMDREMAHQLRVSLNKFRRRKQRALDQFKYEWKQDDEARSYPYWGKGLYC